MLISNFLNIKNLIFPKNPEHEMLLKHFQGQNHNINNRIKALIDRKKNFYTFSDFECLQHLYKLYKISYDEFVALADKNKADIFAEDSFNRKALTEAYEKIEQCLQAYEFVENQIDKYRIVANNSTTILVKFSRYQNILAHLRNDYLIEIDNLKIALHVETIAHITDKNSVTRKKFDDVLADVENMFDPSWLIDTGETDIFFELNKLFDSDIIKNSFNPKFFQHFYEEYGSLHKQIIENCHSEFDNIKVNLLLNQKIELEKLFKRYIDLNQEINFIRDRVNTISVNQPQLKALINQFFANYVESYTNLTKIEEGGIASEFSDQNSSLWQLYRNSKKEIELLSYKSMELINTINSYDKLFNQISNFIQDAPEYAALYQTDILVFEENLDAEINDIESLKQLSNKLRLHLNQLGLIEKRCKQRIKFLELFEKLHKVVELYPKDKEILEKIEQLFEKELVLIKQFEFSDLKSINILPTCLSSLLKNDFQNSLTRIEKLIEIAEFVLSEQQTLELTQHKLNDFNNKAPSLKEIIGPFFDAYQNEFDNFCDDVFSTSSSQKNNVNQYLLAKKGFNNFLGLCEVVALKNEQLKPISFQSFYSEYQDNLNKAGSCFGITEEWMRFYTKPRLGEDNFNNKIKRKTLLQDKNNNFLSRINYVQENQHHVQRPEKRFNFSNDSKGSELDNNSDSFWQGIFTYFDTNPDINLCFYDIKFTVDVGHALCVKCERDNNHNISTYILYDCNFGEISFNGINARQELVDFFQKLGAGYCKEIAGDGSKVGIRCISAAMFPMNSKIESNVVETNSFSLPPT